MKQEKKVLITIFLSSFSTLAFEIALLRVFTISLWYHFAFMIISIAMLGISASGTFLSIFPSLKDFNKIPIYSIMLGLAISISFIILNNILFDPVKLLWDWKELLYLGVYYFFLSLPFFFTGLIIVTALSKLSSKSGLLYCADLIGAGFGTLVILILLTYLSPEKTIFILSNIALTSTILISNGKQRQLTLLLISINFYFLFSMPGITKLKMSPYKGLELALKHPESIHLKTYYNAYSRIDIFKSSMIRFAPGLSLTYLNELPEQLGLSIDGSGLNAITSAKNLKSLSFLEFLPAYLPYKIIKKDDVLILDPKGGLHILIAKTSEAKNIYTVESYKLLMNIIRNEYRDFSGNLYTSNSFPGIGRSWIKSQNKMFDLIDIPLTGAHPYTPFGIGEDFRFTVEAFIDYIEKLKPEGIISINLFIIPPPRVEFRIISTVTSAFKELGINNPDKHIVAIRSWGTITILVKKSEFTEKELNLIKKFIKDKKFDFIYYPGIKEEETNIYIKMPTNEYYNAFKSLLNVETKNNFINGYIFDITPIYDDKPFFNYYLKLSNLKEIYTIMGKKWEFFIEEGLILPALLIQVLIIGILIMIIPSFTITKNYKITIKESKKLLYFVFLGIGFMFIEIPLIQKAILPLENPSFAFTTIVSSILFSSGVGSYLSYRYNFFNRPIVNLVISIIAILVYFLINITIENITHLDITKRIIILFILSMTMGLFMGIPFPLGIKKVGSIDSFLVTWAWAINGTFSVLSPILAMMIALLFGYQIVVWLGAIAYLFAYISFKIF